MVLNKAVSVTQIVHVDVLSLNLNEKYIGCCLDKIVNHLCYADDLVLGSPTVTGICSQESNWQSITIGSGNGLVRNRRQAITWTNADPVH